MTSRAVIAAQKIFPTASPFVDYIEELNQVLSNTNPSANIQLRFDNDQPSYSRFLSRLFIAWPKGNKIVSGFSKDTITTTSVPVDDILSEVIRTSLRRYQSYQQAQQNNVICVGFFVGSENGTCSVLRDLDARSPSAPMQILRAPAAREILKRVGPVLFRHILMYSVLLLDVDPAKEVNADGVSITSGSSFIQLCGPSPSVLNISKRTNTARTVSNVVIRQDILYRCATAKQYFVPQRLSSTKTITEKSTVYYNDGLPISHHLQGIDHSTSSATYLLRVIQSIRNTESFLETDRKSHNKTNAVADKPWTNNYETNASLLRSQNGLPTRGKAWLKNKRAFPPRLRQLRATLKKIIEKTHSNQFRKILGRVCFLNQSLKCAVSKEPKFQTRDMIDMHTPAKDVAVYIVSCTRKMFPLSLFGSTQNRRIFEEAIHALIRRRSLRDRFNILTYFKQSGFAISEVPWLHHRGVNGKSTTNPTDLRFRQKAVDDILIWTIRGVVIPILLHSFYVTETSRHRYKVFYYRREIWNHVIHRSMREMLRNNKQFAILRRDQLIECAKHRKSTIAKLGRTFFPHEVLVYNTLRYIPKISSLRGIQKPRGKMLVGFHGLQPKSLRGYDPKRSSTHLRPIHKALTVFQLLMKNITKIVSYEGRKHQALRGSSVFSLDDVYEKFLSFKRQWINASKPIVYGCCMDISKSFDTLPLDLIFSKIIPNVFSRDRYVLVKYRQNWCDRLTGNVKSKTTTHVCDRPGEEASFVTLVRRKHSHSRFGGTYTDLSSVITLNTDDIITILNEHLKTNIVSVPRHCRSRSESAFAIQSQGLPQGHPLSSWLTSFLYAYIETTDLSKFINPPAQVNTEKDQRNYTSTTADGSYHPLLMRMVDDWAYFSFDKNLTEKFMNRMREGWSNSHGFSINVGKTKLSTSLDSRGTQMIPWCGLLIDSQSIEIRVDYARYDVSGAKLRNSHVMEYQKHPGRAFADKAWSCFKPKLHPLLFDEQINSRSTILLNVYQAALLTSLKTCAYAIETELSNDQFFTEVLKITISKFATLVHQLKASKVAKTNSYRFPLSMGTTRFIFAHAMLAAIKNKLGRYHGFKALSVHLGSNLEHEYLMEKQNLDKYGETPAIQLIEKISRDKCKVLWNLRL